MPVPSNNPQSAARAIVKEERAREGAKALQDYEAEKRAVAAKTERLRELRLAREAEAVAAPPKKATKKKAR
jgi:hypothetical protein